MRPADTAPSHSRPRHGFNLVEAAIVLGVVGLVIGGIWVAASAAKNKNEGNAIASDMGMTFNSILNYSSSGYAFFNGLETGANPIGALTNTLKSMSIIPEGCEIDAFQPNARHVFCKSSKYKGFFFVQIFMRTDSGPVMPELSIGWTNRQFNSSADLLLAPPLSPEGCSNLISGIVRMNSTSSIGTYIAMYNGTGANYISWAGNTSSTPRFNINTALSYCGTGVRLIFFNKKFG